MPNETGVTKSDAAQAVAAMVQRIIAGFHPDKVILFGSYASGVPTDDSDIDLLIVMPIEGSSRSMANEIDLALADRTLPLDLVVITPDQFERQKDVSGTLVSAAVRQGKVIYERAA
jgi:predicted nucleotidyltransferase